MHGWSAKGGLVPGLFGVEFHPNFYFALNGNVILGCWGPRWPFFKRITSSSQPYPRAFHDVEISQLALGCNRKLYSDFAFYFLIEGLLWDSEAGFEVLLYAFMPPCGAAIFHNRLSQFLIILTNGFSSDHHFTPVVAHLQPALHSPFDWISVRLRQPDIPQMNKTIRVFYTDCSACIVHWRRYRFPRNSLYFDMDTRQRTSIGGCSRKPWIRNIGA